MKKKILALLLFLLLGLPLVAISASSYVEYPIEKSGNYIWEIKYEITTDTDGTVNPAISVGYQIPNNLRKIKGMYLLQVDAYPTSGGTAPDTADVFLWDENHIHYLGSEDNGTTAYNGANLIDTSIPKSCMPNMYITGTDTHVNYFWPIRGSIYFTIGNHTTDSANITIILVFTE